jgi:hypothetical protein
MNLQMIRVISSPSSSTTGFSTLIFDMQLRSLHAPASLPPRNPGRARYQPGLPSCPATTAVISW